MRFTPGHEPWNKKKIAWEVNNNGCWICTSHYKNVNGYPVFDYKSKNTLIHRYMYEQYFGTSPNDLKVCHKCDNPGCINPGHMFLGTQGDNVADMNHKGRHGASGAKGERNANSKLTAEQVIKIKTMQGVTQVRLAEMFGVKQSTISDILKGKAWSHIKADAS